MGLKTIRYRANLIGAGVTLTRIETGGMLVKCRKEHFLFTAAVRKV